MPITPSTYAGSTPVTASQLTRDLYTIDGSAFNANGVLFHSNRPMLVETLSEGGTGVNAGKGGQFTILGGGAGDALSVLDNAALFGSGSDLPGDNATFVSQGAVAPGSSGIAGAPGGWGLMFSTIPIGKFSTTTGTYGIGWVENSVVIQPLLDIGCMQPPSNVYSNAGFAVDLLQRLPGVPTTYQPTVFALDVNGVKNTVLTNTVSTVGWTPRFAEIWCGVINGTGTPVSSLPTPMTAITGMTQLSSTALNQTVNQVFNLLNFPPMLNVQSQSTASTSANVISAVPFNFTPLLDSYSSYSTAATSYTVPLSGVYFCHANIIYAETFNSGAVAVGFQVNGTNFFGGSYNATPSNSQNTAASVTKILDLNAGDVIKVIQVTSAATAYGNQNVSHFIMTWMGNLNSSVQNWTPPDVTGFQFAAGTPPESVAALNSNPYFANASLSGWNGFNGTASVVTPAAGAPFPSWAGQYVNNGIASGALEENSGFARIPTTPGRVLNLDCWGWTTGTEIQIGFDFLYNGSYQTSITTRVTVPSSTWVPLSMSATAPSIALNSCYGRIGVSAGSGATVQTQGFLVSYQRPLAPILNEKLVNDVNFLFSRPYLMTHQTVASTGLAVNSALAPVSLAAGGLVHGTLGDNYGGWNSSTSTYTAQVPGWYLALSEISAATQTTVTGNMLTAAFNVPKSGGVNAPTTPQAMPDYYQQLMVAQSWTYPTGATALGVYYLAAGETIQPMMQYKSGTASTWATDTNTSHNFKTHFELVWLSN